MSGYLEFYKEQPEASKAPLLKHLQLLMERAITYSWVSVRNFHLSVNNAVEQGRLSWRSSESCESIRERAQSFFTHQDLRSNNFIPSRSGVSTPGRGKAKDNFCKEWNYSGTPLENAVVPFLMRLIKRFIDVVFATLQIMLCSRAPNANIQYLRRRFHPRPRPHPALIRPPDYTRLSSFQTRLERLACQLF